MTTPLTLPCLRGSFGDWIYYECMMPLTEVAARVHFADEVHDSKALSEFIQRRLDGDRAKKIARYLCENDERFFNSLVLATYKGAPQWFDIGNLRSSNATAILQDVPDGALDTLGLLRLDGSERIFALDGQHRLAGIKRALQTCADRGTETVPVILVGHSTDQAGMRRTRRLFTTLNKTAVPVKKLDIIALDEDDVMAITVRRLVEHDPGFKDPKIAIISSEAMPVANGAALLTISGLYDQLKMIFKYEMKRRGTDVSDDELRFNRPDDAKLDEYHTVAIEYFSALGKAFPPIAEFFASKTPQDVVAKHRTSEGGHVLFRTVGLSIFTQTAVSIAAKDKCPLVDAVSRLSPLPTQLTKPPYRSVIWDPTRRTMKPAARGLARRLIFHLLSLPMSPRERATLLGDYRAALGYERDDTSISLPAIVS